MTPPLWALILGPAILLFVAAIGLAIFLHRPWYIRVPFWLRESLIVAAVLILCTVIQNETFQAVLCAAYLLYVGCVRLNPRRSSRSFR